ncbi:arginine--tRNA ligase [Candidatus Uhrbacteria bacterium RIFCSPLOWO2_02_FULL_51_9]|uniref:Arginine--tRNA ligase n=1 Tax=Candidatus Uhrbacteria bacterium RIFCSPLOWO2_02_FULL_51_9 TaxID=1802410 RepID=A0A1F7VE53_9BACT|nr:MAG: arginine--tRNA ligase [Candidatus Uhrbacteria bacterium RIFCSPLOWO2_02_FULL_51_9]
MNTWQQILSEVLKTVNKTLGVTIDPAQVAIPPDSKFGDIAIPCFSFASAKGGSSSGGKAPGVIAKEWAEKLSATTVFPLTKGGLIESVHASGPYVNITLNAAAVADIVLQKSAGKPSFAKASAGKRVMIEYSQPNTHKEFHVGHLRNATLGAALVNLYRKSGYQVKAANYIGDVGAHVAKCLWALTKFHAKEKPPKGAEGSAKGGRGAWLGKLYVEGHVKTEADETAKEESKEILRKLEAGDKKLTALWKKTRAWSLQQFKDIYKDLGVTFDVWYFESAVENPGKKIVKELLKKKIARISEGATIVDLEKDKLGVFLVLRTDGTSLYSTKDLALAQEKFKKYKLDESIYVVDNRQSQYFKQLFRTLELMGFKKKMAHVAYEMVTTSGGAMSSRAGNVIRYEEVRAEVEARLQKETKTRHPDWSAKKVAGVAHSIMLGALKFMMLQHDPSKVVVFNMDEALAFDGYTGPYIQYSYARIASILRKAPHLSLRGGHQADEATPSGLLRRARNDEQLLTEPEAKRLLLMLARFLDTVEEARVTYNPAVLCRYLYETAKSFTDFYSKHKVLCDDPHQRAARLMLCQATQDTLQAGMDILGIPWLGEM